MSVLSSERDLSISICGLDLASESLLVLLSAGEKKRHYDEEAEQEEQLVLVSVDGVHSLKSKWFAEALIAHVESGCKTKVSHSIFRDKYMFEGKKKRDEWYS